MSSSLNLPRFLAVLLMVSVVVLMAGCSPKAAQSTFDVGGPVARMQLDLFKIVLGVAVFVFVVVEGVLLFVIIRFRRRTRQRMPPQMHGNTPLEVAWTLAPTLVLLVIALPTVSTQFAVSNPPSAPDVEVRVVAHQWWWEFQYPDQGVVTANELYIPVGKVVKLTLESQDVIHSFWVPNLAGKMDLIPNRMNSMWLQADEIKTYQGQCAEFCGVAHALMRFRVVAVPQPEFEVWVQGHKTPPPMPIGEAEMGAALFLQRGCAACHSIQGTAAQGKVGPNLTMFGSRMRLAAGTLENDAEGENLARWLRDPQSVKPGTKMPNLRLSDEDISALVAYLQSLK